jgi:hypothetical protein
VYIRTSNAAGVSSGLAKYSVVDLAKPGLDELVQVGAQGNQMSQADMALDTKHSVAVMLGDRSRRFAFWDVGQPGTRNVMQSVPSVTDLTGSYSLGQNSGMDYDPQRQRFLLWNGASDVWELKLPDELPMRTTGWQVRRIADSEGPAGELLPQSGGAIGKWKYAPGLDVFLALREAPKGDVWIFKPENWNDPAR